MTAYATGGNGSYDYIWEPSSGLSDPTISNPVATPLETTTYMVTVSDANSSVSDDVTITVNPSPETPIVNQEGEYLTSTSETGNQWYDSNGAITGATGQEYYPVSTEYYYVIVTNSSGCVSDQSNVIYFIYTGISSISAANIEVYPNPSNGMFIIDLGNLHGNYNIRVTDVLNQIVYENKHEINNGDKLQIDLGNQEKGVYFIKIRSSGSEITKKVIVQ